MASTLAILTPCSLFGGSRARRLQQGLRAHRGSLDVSRLTGCRGGANLASTICAQAQASSHLSKLSGKWKKNWDESEDMTSAMDLVALPKLVRASLPLVKTMEVELIEGERFTSTLNAGPLKIRESYPLAKAPEAPGEVVKHRRRDLRLGHHTGCARTVPDAASVVLAYEWRGSYGGEGEDTFWVAETGNKLFHRTKMVMADGSGEVAYTIVYDRL